MRVPAGWYSDPESPGALRYWDGYAWTQHKATRSLQEPAIVRQPVVVAAEPRNPGLPGLSMAVVGFAAGAVIAFLVIHLLISAGRSGGATVEIILSELPIWAGMLIPVFLASRFFGTGNLSTDYDWTIKTVDLGIGSLGAIVGRAATIIVALPLYAAFHDLLRQPQVGPSPGKVTGLTWVAYGIIACIGAPIIEELFFRGLIQTRLVGLWGPGWGIAVTSLAFGAAHLIGWVGPASFLTAASIAGGGAVLGLLRYRTGRLGTSTVAHSLFNCMAFALLLATTINT